LFFSSVGQTSFTLQLFIRIRVVDIWHDDSIDNMGMVRNDRPAKENGWSWILQLWPNQQL
jgi:hypothetical protein